MNRRVLILGALVGLFSIIAVACGGGDAPAAPAAPQAPAAPAAAAPAPAAPAAPAAAAPAAPAAPAASKAKQDAVAAPQHGGRITTYWTESGNLDPHQASYNGTQFSSQIFNGLVEMDRSPELMGTTLVPSLAKSWKFSADGKEVTFQLESGIKFHDGETFGCEDVQYSLQRNISAPEGMRSARRGAFLSLESVECPDGPDGLTVVSKLNRPQVDFVFNMSDPRLVMMAKHVAKPSDEAGRFNRQWEDMIGTGAFVKGDFRVNEILTVERGSDYWGNNLGDRGELPYLDGVDIFPQPSDFQTTAGAIRSGRINWLQEFGVKTIFDKLQVEGEANGLWTLSANPRSTFISFIPTWESPWTDPEVRLAMQLAFPQDEFIAATCDLSFACWSRGMLVVGHPWLLSQAEMEQIPGFGPDKEANRAQAREIIKRKGLEGYTVGISAWAALRPSTAGSLAVCGMLQKVGMNCTTNFMEVGPYYSMVNARRIPKGEVVVHPSGPSLNSVDVSLGEVFHPDGARNYGAYPRDPVLLDLYAKQSAEQDPEVRGELVREYQRYFLSKHYHILLAQRGVGAFWASNIHNLSDGLIFTWPSRLDNVWIG